MNIKRILAITIAAGLTVSSSAYAAEQDTGAPPEPPAGSENIGGQPPQMPDGQPPEMPNGQPPEMPNGQQPEMPDGQPPEAPNGQQSQMNVELPFTDVADDAWYHDAVATMYGTGIIKGTSDTEFSPEGTLSAAQILTMLYRADGGTESGETWYAPAMEWASANGIIGENPDFASAPNEDITREDMMLVIYNYLVYKNELPEGRSDLSEFTDGADVSDYAQTAVQSLVGAGIIQGDGGTLRSKSTLTRAEAATILSRIIRPQSPPDGMGGMPGDMGGAPGGMPPGGVGGSGEVTQGTSANTISEDGSIKDTSYESSGDDENALRIDGAAVTLDGISVNKSGGASSNTENGDFYGQRAALLATNGANVTITNADIKSDAKNGNGVFSYGEGTVVNISDSTITTQNDSSGGIQTTGGGTTNASNLTVVTSGNSAAAIRSDRGGGTVSVDGGAYTSNGYNSPAVYSTADITVKNAELTANNSEALVIEGKNSIALENCAVSGNMSDTKGVSSDENVHNIIIYQSMSGDADVGTSGFSMNGGTLTGNNGDMIYITNTRAVISMSGVTIDNKDADGCLMRVTGNSASRGWGKAGSNGAQAEFTADNQTLNGDIIVDTISSLDMRLTNKSEFTGTVNITDNEQGGTAVQNNAVITIDEGSVWTLTGDCTVTSLENNGTINYNGYTITLADGTVLSE